MHSHTHTHLTPRIPQIDCLSVPVRMFAHVQLQTLPEELLAQHGTHHVDHGTTLAVGYGIEHL